MAAVSTRANEAGTALRTIFFGLLDDVASDPQVTDLAVTCDGRVWADRGNGTVSYTHLTLPTIYSV